MLEQWPEDYERLWEMLEEQPEHNFDDTRPHTLPDFTIEMVRRQYAGEKLFIVYLNCFVIGYIGCRRLSTHKAIFRGICFAQAFHGKGLAKQAVDEVIDRIFDSGITELYAQFFETNEKIYRLLMSLGAEDRPDRGYTTQNGKKLPVRSVVIRKRLN